MGVTSDVRHVGRGLGIGRPVDELARWWTSATQEERFLLLRTTLDKRAPKTKSTPDLGTLQLAILLAESEAGEIDQR